MAVARSRRILLASRPHGEPTPDNFRLVEAEAPAPGPGQMLLCTIYLSLDPYMRGRMNAGPSYARPVEVGEVMEGGTVCEVVESNLSGYGRGDIVVARTGWQELALSDGDGVRKLDPAFGPISYGLGVLGMPGFTAYTGLLNIGRPKPGETLVVAAASGAVGSVVEQVAKIKGCRVVGIAGGEQKCRYVGEELGFDACLDHRRPDLPDRLKAACPSGVDIYFENVGGAVFDAVLPLLNDFARVPVCGLIAHYNATGLPAVTGRDQIGSGDWRANNPRFSGDNIARNQALLKPLEEIAQAHGAKPAQVVLAWVLSRGENVIPIPGMKRRTHLDENVAAVDIELTPEELARLDAAFPPGAAAGERYTPEVARWAGR